MGRTPCCDKDVVKRGSWSPDEDLKLVQYINQYGHGSWRTLPKNAGRTDNEVKNFWNTHLRKRVFSMGCYISQENESLSSTEPSIEQSVSLGESESIEAHLSSQSTLLNTSSAAKPDSDFFLQLWNSGVGDGFRNINEKDDVESKSPVWGSKNLKPASVDTVNARPAFISGSSDTIVKLENEEKLYDGINVKLEDEEKPDDGINVNCSISSFNELAYSLDASSQLPFDFSGCCEMEFLEHMETFSDILDLKPK
ncbi:hypothetical protein ACFE04_004125 [Oxalis oulophora]